MSPPPHINFFENYIVTVSAFPTNSSPPSLFFQWFFDRVLFYLHKVFDIFIPVVEYGRCYFRSREGDKFLQVFFDEGRVDIFDKRFQSDHLFVTEILKLTSPKIKETKTCQTSATNCRKHDEPGKDDAFDIPVGEVKNGNGIRLSILHGEQNVTVWLSGWWKPQLYCYWIESNKNEVRWLFFFS